MHRPPLKTILVACLLWVTAVVPATLMAQQSLHEKIDGLIEADQFFGAGPLASDSEFMRRVYLDLVGTTPGSQQVRDFIADESPDKRKKLVIREDHDQRVGIAANSLDRSKWWG